MKARFTTVLIVAIYALLNANAFSIELGKSYWVGTPVILCQAPDRSGSQCEFIDTHPHFTITGAERGAKALPYAKIVFDNGHGGYVLASELADSALDYDPIAKEARDSEQQAARLREYKKHGQPRIGMTAKELTLTCWGKPDHVNRTQTAGAVIDQYVYEDDKYVYLRNGIVTAIQVTGTVK